MPLVLNENGLQIQTIDEIKSELEAEYRGVFGDNVDVSAESPFGQIIGIHAEREAKVQQTLQLVYNAFDPNAARGVQLDRLAALTGSTRDKATFSTAAALFTGTPITGSGVRLAPMPGR